MNVKPGYKTTEFWVTVATSLAVLISALSNGLPPKYAAIAGTIVAGLYSVSRGLTKLHASGWDSAIARAVTHDVFHHDVPAAAGVEAPPPPPSPGPPPVAAPPSGP